MYTTLHVMHIASTHYKHYIYKLHCVPERLVHVQA